MLTVAVLLVSVFADMPQVETVCANNHCVGTKTNPIPRGATWLSQGIISKTGCCFMWHGPCESCIQPYSCYHYQGKQDDAWCKEQEQNPKSGLVYTGDYSNRPDLYQGCGWCSCCAKTDPKTGLPVNNYGAADGTMGDLTVLGDDVKKAQAAATSAGLPTEEETVAVVKPGSSSTFDYAVNGFAVLGFAIVLFGAFKHYSSKTQEHDPIL